MASSKRAKTETKRDAKRAKTNDAPDDYAIVLSGEVYVNVDLLMHVLHNTHSPAADEFRGWLFENVFALAFGAVDQNPEATVVVEEAVVTKPAVTNEERDQRRKTDIRIIDFEWVVEVLTERLRAEELRTEVVGLKFDATYKHMSDLRRTIDARNCRISELEEFIEMHMD